MSTTKQPEMKSFILNIKEQIGDGLIELKDLIKTLEKKVKVRNSNIIARRDVEYKDLETAVEVVHKKGDIRKADMKQYMRRFLRAKNLRDFIRVVGDGKDEISLEYVNTVNDNLDDSEEEE